MSRADVEHPPINSSTAPGSIRQGRWPDDSRIRGSHKPQMMHDTAHLAVVFALRRPSVSQQWRQHPVEFALDGPDLCPRYRCHGEPVQRALLTCRSRSGAPQPASGRASRGGPARRLGEHSRHSVLKSSRQMEMTRNQFLGVGRTRSVACGSRLWYPGPRCNSATSGRYGGG